MEQMCNELCILNGGLAFMCEETCQVCFDACEEVNPLYRLAFVPGTRPTLIAGFCS
jgi:hypothetical protein